MSIINCLVRSQNSKVIYNKGHDAPFDGGFFFLEKIFVMFVK